MVQHRLANSWRSVSPVCVTQRFPSDFRPRLGSMKSVSYGVRVRSPPAGDINSKSAQCAVWCFDFAEPASADPSRIRETPYRNRSPGHPCHWAARPCEAHRQYSLRPRPNGPRPAPDQRVMPPCPLRQGPRILVPFRQPRSSPSCFSTAATLLPSRSENAEQLASRATMSARPGHKARRPCPRDGSSPSMGLGRVRKRRVGEARRSPRASFTNKDGGRTRART